MDTSIFTDRCPVRDYCGLLSLLTIITIIIFPSGFQNYSGIARRPASRSRRKSAAGVFGRSPAFCHAHYVFRSHTSVAHGTKFLRPKSSKPFWIRPLAITTDISFPVVFFFNNQFRVGTAHLVILLLKKLLYIHTIILKIIENY